MGSAAGTAGTERTKKNRRPKALPKLSLSSTGASEMAMTADQPGDLPHRLPLKPDRKMLTVRPRKIPFPPHNLKRIMRPDLYQTLEVSPTASDEEIKRAYRRLALLYHPDRNRDGAEAEERFKAGGHAYSILGDQDKRKRYDLYRQFMNLSARWGIPPSPSQEGILEEIFLDPRFPGLGKWLEEILREKRLADGGHPFRTFLKTTLRFFLFIRREGRRRKSPATRRQNFRIASLPKRILNGCFRGHGRRRPRGHT